MGDVECTAKFQSQLDDLDSVWRKLEILALDSFDEGYFDANIKN